MTRYQTNINILCILIQSKSTTIEDYYTDQSITNILIETTNDERLYKSGADAVVSADYMVHS